MLCHAATRKKVFPGRSYLLPLCMLLMVLNACKGSLQGGGVAKDSSITGVKDSIHNSPVRIDTIDESGPDLKTSDGLPAWALNPKPLNISLIILPVSQGRLSLQIYSPAPRLLPFPVVLYFPGVKGIGSHLVSPGAIARQTRSVVVLVKYRIFNGQRYPVESTEAFTAYLWVIRNIALIRGDAKAIAVLGESFGGNLAIHVSIMARDRGYILPVHQILVYPLGIAKPGLWHVKNYSTFWMNPVNSADHLPLRLRGLEPSTIITNDQDPLHNDVMVLAARIRAAGNRVKTKNYSGMVISFFGIAPFHSEANNPQMYASFMLREVFGTTL